MGSQSDAVILLYIFAFYAVIIFFLGLIGGFQVSKLTYPSNQDYGLDFGDYIGFFFEGIAFSIAELGIFNFLLFAPMGLTLLYLLVKLLRGGG
jgi:hypothetical protein